MKKKDQKEKDKYWKKAEWTDWLGFKEEEEDDA